jgi:hypothetical protein
MRDRKTFHFEFDDEGPRTLTFEYDGQYEQRSETIIEDGVPVLYVNKQACAVLAKVFGKMALGSYQPGFHVHLEKDFNAEREEMLRIVLLPDAPEPTDQPTRPSNAK